MNKMIITGAAGQLGRQWQAFLTTLGREKVVSIPYTSSQLDITRYDQLEHEIIKQQPDVIINCAAYTNVDGAEDEREKARRTNAEAVRNLAEECTRLDIKLVHFSTDYVFAGRKEDVKCLPNGYPEDHKVDPVNCYGQTKWEGEQAIRQFGCAHLIMRVSWLCGAYGTNFVKTMLRLGGSNDQLDIVDDQTGSPTFAHQLVKNTFKLIEENKKGTYHFTSQGLISWADFAEAIFERAGQKVKVNRIPSSQYPTKAVRPFFSKLNTKKIEQVPGIEIEPWKVGLNHLIKTLHG